MPSLTISFNPCSLGCCSESSRFQSSWTGKNGVSILVLLDVALKVLPSELDNHPELLFQSLFSWMLLWKADGAGRWWPAGSVSILVLLDVALKAASREILVVPCSVSILVLLDVALKDLSYNSRWVWLLVSILVLLDVALKVFAPTYGHGQKTQFQSLFSWMLLWKPEFATALAEVKNVSILVLLDVALKDDPVLRWRVSWERFQSLFSWMLLWKAVAEIEESMFKLGFNPCSLGCCSESPTVDHIISISRPICFNPCSLGCCSERQRVYYTDSGI